MEKILGKFESVEALSKAYQQLEGAFTAKCQDLSAAIKQLNRTDTGKENIAEETHEKAILAETLPEQTLETVSGKDIAENIVFEEELTAETVFETTPAEQLEESIQETAPETSEDVVTEEQFLKNAPEEAQEVIPEDAADILLVAEEKTAPQTEVLPKEPDYENLIQQEEFLNKYVYNNAQIRDKIVTAYLNEIASIKPPQLITRDKGNMSLIPANRPRTLEDASMLAKLMLKQ